MIIIPRIYKAMNIYVIKRVLTVISAVVQFLFNA